MSDDIEEAPFYSEEYDYIADILEGAYHISTAAGGEDEVIKHFIEALRNGCTIVMEDSEDIEEKTINLFETLRNRRDE